MLFFSLKITKKSLSAILSSCCNFLYAQSWENMSLLMNTNILCELNMKSMLNQHKKLNMKIRGMPYIVKHIENDPEFPSMENI